MTTQTMSDITARLIKENADAPADTLIRAIFAVSREVRDHDDGALIESAQAALEIWYGVDELRIDFALPYGDRRRSASFVYLVHQHTHSRPHIDDISDYGTSCDNVPELAAAIDENNYRLIYTD